MSQTGTHPGGEDVAFGADSSTYTLVYCARGSPFSGAPVPLPALVQTEVAPSQLDVAEACREALHEAGIFPIPRFVPDLAENQEEPEYALPLAA